MYEKNVKKKLKTYVVMENKRAEFAQSQKKKVVL